MVLEHEFPDGIALINIGVTRLGLAKTTSRKGSIDSIKA
jgi:hypothetical protein